MSNLKYNTKIGEKESLNKDKPLPFFMRLYPPLETKERSSITINKILNLDDTDENKKENPNETILTKQFLDQLVNNPHSIPKSKIFEIVSNAMQNSHLIEKLEDDNKNSKKMNQEDLSNAFAKKFTFRGEKQPGARPRNYFWVLTFFNNRITPSKPPRGEAQQR